MGWDDNYLNITWEDFRTLAFKLAGKITTSKQKFDLIVAIARGGLTLSQILSDSLSLPIASFTIQSYSNLKQEKLPQITYGLSGSLKNKKILLVDDVSDHGKTFIRGLAYLEELGARKKDITTATIHLKPHSIYKPDFYVSVTPKWIIYPSESLESMEILSRQWQERGISQKEIKKRFLRFQFPRSQIAQVLKI